MTHCDHAHRVIITNYITIELCMQLLDLQRQLTNANCEFLIGYYKHALKYVVFRIWSKCLFPLVVCIMFMLCVLHVGLVANLM